MLDKRLELGGLQVGGPRTTQNPSRFRVANNVYQTRDNYYVPRFHGEEYLDGFSDSPRRLVSMHEYEKAPFIISTVEADDTFIAYHDSSTKIPCPAFLGFLNSEDDPFGGLGSFAVQSVEKLGCLFYHVPTQGLYKYDGVQTYQAGSPLPLFSCAQYASAGATFVRLIQHHIDFQGNIVNSGYVEFPATPSGSNIVIRTDQGVTDLVNSGSANVSPTSRPNSEQLNITFDSFFFVASSAVFAAGNVTYTTAGNHSVAVGAYILISVSSLPDSTTGVGATSYALAVKVLSSTGTTVVCSCTDAKYLDTNYEWQDSVATLTEAYVEAITVGCNYWMSAWTSNAATGNYVYKGLAAAPYLSTASYSTTINVASPTVPAASTGIAFNLAGNLGDIYDVTSVKQCFNGSFIGNSKAFSTHADLATIATSNEVYFSDVSLGGAFEMTTGSGFIVVGEGDDGDIQSICGNADFTVVSRQCKNYFVSGTLPTAGYRVQEIEQTNLGSFSNESMISTVGKIFLLNKHGLWAVYPGGRCEEVSINVQGFFDNYSNTTSYAEEAYFDLDSYPTYGTTATDDNWIRLRLDVNRNLLAVIKKGDGQGEALILNLNNGEFYTWSGMLEGYGTAPYDFKDLVFIDGIYYLTVNDATMRAVYSEDKVIAPYAYMSSDYAPEMESTWFSAGEPSLEKKINQYKLWGNVIGSVQMGYYLDWNTGTLVDADTYVNAVSGLFSHKNGLPPANALSVSVRIKLNTTKFELEGAELEFQPFQQGMKR